MSTGEVRGGRVRPVGVVGGQKVTGKVAVGLSDGRGGQGRGRPEKKMNSRNTGEKRNSARRHACVGE